MTKEEELLLKALLEAGRQPVPINEVIEVFRYGSEYVYCRTGLGSFEPQEFTVFGAEFCAIRLFTSVDWFGCKAVVTEMWSWEVGRFDWDSEEFRITVSFAGIVS